MDGEQSNTPTLDWDTAPSEFRRAYEELSNDLKQVKDQLSTQKADLEGYRKREVFEKAIAEAQITDLSLEDVADLPIEQLTPTVLRARREEREAARKGQLTQVAKDAGYESVEEFQEALNAVKAQRSQQQDALQQQSAVATVNTPPPGEPEPASPQEQAVKAFSDAMKQGLPQDEARAMYIAKLSEASDAAAANA